MSRTAVPKHSTRGQRAFKVKSGLSGEPRFGHRTLEKCMA
jgi:hypothetical protein